MQALWDFQLFFENRDENVHGDCNPYLGLDGVVGGPVEGLHAQMLLDPFEEQLHLPAVLVKLADRRGWKGQVVGEEDEEPLVLRVEVSDPAQLLGIVLAGPPPVEPYDLVAANAAAGRLGPGQMPYITQLSLGGNHEVCRRLPESRAF